MKVYKETDKYTIYNGDSMEMLSVVAPSSVDCIITDPPYELGFMNNKLYEKGMQEYDRNYMLKELRNITPIKDEASKIKKNLMFKLKRS